MISKWCCKPSLNEYWMIVKIIDFENGILKLLRKGIINIKGYK